MPYRLSLAEVAGRGVQFQWHEAVAIAQRLIEQGPSLDAVEPFGPPALDNVLISADGAVACSASATTPAVSEVAILLDAMLRSGARMKVPGALRYTLARALLEVDVPPFDSLDEFSAALRRYEQADRSTAIGDLYRRAAAVESAPPAAAGDRRRTSPSVTELRRRLREADEERFYLLQAGRSDTGAIARAAAPAAAPSTATPSVARMPPVDADRFRPEPAVLLNPIGPIFGAEAARRSGAARWIAGGLAAALAAFAAGYSVVDYVRSHRDMPRPAVASAPSADPTSHADLPDAPVTHGERPPANRPAPSVDSDDDAAAPHPGSRDVSLVRAVDRSAGPAFSPAFASNGTALFFHTGRTNDPRSALEAADLRGDDLRVMTIVDDGSRNYHVHPSPDGSRVAFDSDRDGERGVYIANRDGTGVRRVSGAGYAAVPTWSPDGERLAFVRAETDRPHVWNLWLLTIASGETRRITSFRYGQTWAASWFADGRRICYTHEDQLAVLDLDSGQTRTFKSPLAHRLVRTPAVSPDGAHVIFQVARSGAWLLDLADGSMRCVLTDPTAEEFAWSPDGRRVAFHSRRDGQWAIWLMAPS